MSTQDEVAADEALARRLQEEEYSGEASYFFPAEQPTHHAHGNARVRSVFSGSDFDLGLHDMHNGEHLRGDSSRRLHAYHPSVGPHIASGGAERRTERADVRSGGAENSTTNHGRPRRYPNAQGRGTFFGSPLEQYYYGQDGFGESWVEDNRNGLLDNVPPARRRHPHSAFDGTGRSGGNTARTSDVPRRNSRAPGRSEATGEIGENRRRGATHVDDTYQTLFGRVYGMEGDDDEELGPYSQHIRIDTGRNGGRGTTIHVTTGGTPGTGPQRRDNMLDMMTRILGSFGNLPGFVNGDGNPGLGNTPWLPHVFGGMGVFVGDEEMSYEDLQTMIDRIGHVNRGATDQEISDLPTEKYSRSEAGTRQGSARNSASSSSSASEVDEKEKCAICLADYEEGDEVKRLPCSHTFCIPCISRWLQINKECPCCKVSIRDKPRGQS